MKRKLNKEEDTSTTHQHELIPRLPDHLAQIPLSIVNNPTLLFSVCHSWRRLLYSSTYPPFLSLYTLLSSSTTSIIHLSSFDPISSTWHPLPPPPVPPHRPLLLRHPSFIARNLPVQSLSLNNRLVLLSATTHQLLPALSHPLIFNPSTRKWLIGPEFSAPRRWCVSGAVHGTVFLASGSGSEYNAVVARSAEKWVLESTPGIEFGSGSESGFGQGDNGSQCLPRLIESDFVSKSVSGLKCCMDNKKARTINSSGLDHDPVDKWIESATGFGFGPRTEQSIGIEEPKSRNGLGSGNGWEDVGPMKNGRFSREAVEGVGWRGRVCMVNNMKEGALYNMETDAWEEMPEGMLRGWNGPATAMDEDEMYMVNEKRGVLLRYVAENDSWEEVLECRLMKGAAKMAAGGGRVCVVCGNGGGVVVVDVVSRPVRMWLVEAPREMNVVGVHVLPRMSRTSEI